MTPHEAKLRASASSEASIEVAFHRLGVAIVTVRGAHDGARKHALIDALGDAEPQLNVLVDLSECTSIDPSVIAALSATAAELEVRGGGLSQKGRSTCTRKDRRAR